MGPLQSSGFWGRWGRCLWHGEGLGGCASLQKGFVDALGAVGVSPWGHGETPTSGPSSWGCRVGARDSNLPLLCCVCVSSKFPGTSQSVPPPWTHWITELWVEREEFVLSPQNGLPTQHWGPPNWQRGRHASTHWVSPQHWVTPQQWVSPLALKVTPLAPRAGSGTVLGAAGCYWEWCRGDTGSYWEDSRGLGDSASAEGCGDTGKVLIKGELELGAHLREWVVSRVSLWHWGAH